MSYAKRYDYDRAKQSSKSTAITNTEKSRTHRYMKDECDINMIMKKFEKTGELPNMIKNNPQYGDFSQAPDYQEALHTVMHAQEQFSNLSAKIRNRFNNDPSQFLEFATNPENLQEMVKMGLAEQRPATEAEVSAAGLPPRKAPKNTKENPLPTKSEEGRQA